MGQGKTSRPVSRCTTPQEPALTWVDYIDPGHPSVVELHSWLGSLPPARQQLVEGEIEARCELAAKGQISEYDDRVFEPVSLHPLLFELKWHFRVSGGKRRELRQYHAEPPSTPTHLIALHKHLKNIKGTKAEIDDRQNQQMSQAELRHQAGERSSWSLGH